MTMPAIAPPLSPLLLVTLALATVPLATTPAVPMGEMVGPIVVAAAVAVDVPVVVTVPVLNVTEPLVGRRGAEKV